MLSAIAASIPTSADGLDTRLCMTSILTRIFGTLPDAVYEWATIDGTFRPYFENDVEVCNFHVYHDHRGWKLNDFADALENMSPDRDYDGA